MILIRGSAITTLVHPFEARGGGTKNNLAYPARRLKRVIGLVAAFHKESHFQITPI